MCGKCFWVSQGCWLISINMSEFHVWENMLSIRILQKIGGQVYVLEVSIMALSCKIQGGPINYGLYGISSCAIVVEESSWNGVILNADVAIKVKGKSAILWLVWDNVYIPKHLGGGNNIEFICAYYSSTVCLHLIYVWGYTTSDRNGVLRSWELSLETWRLKLIYGRSSILESMSNVQALW